MYLERLIHDEDAADSGDYIELIEEEWDRMEREALAEVATKSHHGT